MSFENRSRSAFVWSLVERIGTQAINILTQILLARILIPADFGHFAILSAFLGLGETLVRSGLALPLIRDPNPSQLDISSIFYFSLGVALILTILLSFLAPHIASLYDSPLLTSLVRVAAIGMLFHAFALVPGAILTKEMKFLELGVTSMTSSLLSGVVGVLMAAGGFGIWSLVATSLGMGLMNSIQLWSKCGWRPTREFSWRALHRFLSLGFILSGVGLVDAIVSSVYLGMLGRLVPATDVGLYSRAKQLPDLPVGNLYNVVSRPSISIFSRLQNDREKLCQYFRSTISVFAMIVFPLMAAVAATANALVQSLLTSKWLGAVPFIQLFCIASAIYPLQRIVLNLLATLGESRLVLKLELCRNGLLIASLVASAHLGIRAIVIGQVVASLATYVLAADLASAATGLSFSRQLAIVFPHAVISAAVGFAMFTGSILALANPFELLILQLLIGVLVYWVLAQILRIPIIAQLKALLNTGAVA
ncbi:MAG TPA: lipopolysaccharide biosynthesis protein [Lacunisphaera sp.]|nr:lipopolysaccharide biosynthesis protein [Lacunisphaera sp.]